MAIPQRPIIYSRKIAVMGYPCVGKSSITLRYVTGTIPEAYDTTVEDLHDKNVRFRGRDFALRITDTAGQQEWTVFPNSCSVGIDGYLLVYSIDDRKSFDVVQDIRQTIVESVGDDVPILLVGNKLDLQTRMRVVSKEEGEVLAKKWGAAFIEFSAVENAGSAQRLSVNELFERLILAIEVRKGTMTETARANNGRDNTRCTIQ